MQVQWRRDALSSLGILICLEGMSSRSEHTTYLKPPTKATFHHHPFTHYKQIHITQNHHYQISYQYTIDIPIHAQTHNTIKTPLPTDEKRKRAECHISESMDGSGHSLPQLIVTPPRKKNQNNRNQVIKGKGAGIELEKKKKTLKYAQEKA
ncbi:hypothetical protein BDD12DRAFT_99546 [Trichophaea hybrida]|nr:hypothetical protein BDD12DRAFT_99546 [Trichophaea hybrida]